MKHPNMSFDTQPCPLTLFSGRATTELSSAELRLVAIGGRLQQILDTGELSFPALFETKAAYASVEQLAPACKDVHAMVVIAELSSAVDLKIAESVARMSLDAGNPLCFLINIGEMPKDSQSAFSSCISMCHGFSPDLLDALVDGLIRLQIEMGWVGVDSYDVASALESTDRNAFAAIGFATSTSPGMEAAQAAIDDLIRGNIDISDASGAVAMIVVNGAGLSQAKAAMTLIRQAMRPEAPLAISCHPVSGHPFSVRVTLIAKPKPGRQVIKRSEA